MALRYVAAFVLAWIVIVIMFAIFGLTSRGWADASFAFALGVVIYVRAQARRE